MEPLESDSWVVVVVPGFHVDVLSFLENVHVVLGVNHAEEGHKLRLRSWNADPREGQPAAGHLARCQRRGEVERV